MLVLLLGHLLLGCAAEPASSAAGPGAPPPAPVKVEIAAPVALDHREQAVGVVATTDSVEVRAETSGRVEGVGFTDGQTVRAGQVLVRLRDVDAQAGLLDARGRARLSGLALERARALLARGDVAQAEVDRAEADDALARAAVARAEEALRRTTVVAPFDGVVGRRNVSVGQTVDPSQALTRIESLAQLAVDVSLPESALATVALDQVATVEIDALGIRVPARVAYVAPRVRDDSRTVDVRVALSGTEPRVRPGMSARVEIVTRTVSDAILVPTQALVPGAAGMSVWVAGPDDTVHLAPVQTGERQPDRIELVSGVAAGDRVVVEGLARLRPGAKVVIPPPAAAP